MRAPLVVRAAAAAALPAVAGLVVLGWAVDRIGAWLEDGQAALEDDVRAEVAHWYGVAGSSVPYESEVLDRAFPSAPRSAPNGR